MKIQTLLSLLVLMMLLTACADHGQKVTQSNFAPLQTYLTNVKTTLKKAETTAQGIVAHGTTAGSEESSILFASLQDAESEEIAAEAQAKSLKDFDSSKVQVANQNLQLLTDAQMQLREVEPKLKRNHVVGFVSFGFGCLIGMLGCFFGASVQDCYPILKFIPTAWIGLVSGAAFSLAGGILFSAAYGICIIFGIL